MPELAGYLEKYSGGKAGTGSRLRRFSLGFGNSLAKWDRRYFVLHDGSAVLAYHKTQEDAQSSSKPALGTASCDGCVVNTDKDDQAVLHLTLKDRILSLRAANAAAAHEWMEAIAASGALVGASAGSGGGSDDSGGGGLQGMLLRQNKGKFEKRYFALRDGVLTYYKAETDLAPGSKKPALGSMAISMETRVDMPTPKAGDPRVVFVVSNADTTFNLKGSSEDDARRWIDAIIAAGGTASGTLAGGAGPSTPRAGAAKARGGKRMGVSAETGDVDTFDGKRVIHPKSDDARAFIFSVVQDSGVFAGASLEQREQLVDAMEERQAAVGDMVIRQGDAGNHYFVVRSGEFAVLLKQKGDTPVHKYRPGGAFGELALLYNKPRAASIKCTAPGVIYALDRTTFRTVLMTGVKERTDVSTRLLKRVHLLEGLTDTQLQSLVSILIEEKLEDGQMLCEQGAPMDSLYMVKEGLVHQSSSSKERHGGSGVQPYQAGDCFGQSALADEAGAAAPAWPGTVTAVGACTVMRLKRDQMVELLGDLSTLMRDNFQQRVLGSIEMFKALSPSELSVLVDALMEARYVSGDRIINQGDDGDTFYIVKSGTVRVSVASGGQEKEIAKLGVGDYFGEMALLNASPRMASVTAVEPTTCMTVDRATFGKVLGPLQELLEREAARRQAEVDALKNQKDIALADLKEIGTLGVGTFGRVKLVEQKSTGKKVCARARALAQEAAHPPPSRCSHLSRRLLVRRSAAVCAQGDAQEAAHRTEAGGAHHEREAAPRVVQPSLPHQPRWCLPGPGRGVHGARACAGW